MCRVLLICTTQNGDGDELAATPSGGELVGRTVELAIAWEGAPRSIFQLQSSKVLGNRT